MVGQDWANLNTQTNHSKDIDNDDEDQCKVT